MSNILLAGEEIKRAVLSTNTGFCDEVAEEGSREMGAVAKTQAKRIAVKLQAIYNIADLGTSDRKMGEFIQKLMEEVNED